MTATHTTPTGDAPATAGVEMERRDQWALAAAAATAGDSDAAHLSDTFRTADPPVCTKTNDQPHTADSGTIVHVPAAARNSSPLPPYYSLSLVPFGSAYWLSTRRWFGGVTVLVALVCVGLVVFHAGQSSADALMVFANVWALLVALFPLGHAARFERRVLVALLLHSFDYQFMLLNVAASAIGSMWCTWDASGRAVFNSLCTNFAFITSSLMAVSMDAAPMFDSVIVSLLAGAMALNSARIFVQDRVAPTYVNRYLCVGGEPESNAATGSASGGVDNVDVANAHLHCISSRSLAFGGHFGLMVFFVKYLVLAVYFRWKGRQRECVFLRVAVEVQAGHAHNTSDSEASDSGTIHASGRVAPPDPLTDASAATRTCDQLISASHRSDDDEQSQLSEVAVVPVASECESSSSSPIRSAVQSLSDDPVAAPSIPVHMHLRAMLSPALLSFDAVVPNSDGASHITFAQDFMSAESGQAEVNVASGHRQGGDGNIDAGSVAQTVATHDAARSVSQTEPPDRPVSLDRNFATHVFEACRMPNSRLDGALHRHPTRYVVALVSGEIAVILGTYAGATLHTAFSYFLLLFFLAFISLVVWCESSRVDRVLLRRLMRSFDWWWLLFQTAVHCAAGGACYSDTNPLINLVTFANYGVIMVILISLDAFPLYSPRLKRVCLLFSCLNVLRVLLMNFLTTSGLYPAYVFTFVYTINTHDLAVSSFFTVALYQMRYLIRLIRRPQQFVTVNLKAVPRAKLAQEVATSLQ